MAHGRKEIEVKVSLTKKEFENVRKKVAKMAGLMRTVKQKDEYFTPPHRNFIEPKYPFEWLSVRQRGDKIKLNYKHFYPEGEEEHTHCDETEVDVKNIEELEKMMSALNFHHLVTVEKEREVFMYGDEFEIALDTVKDLGYFVEVEALKDFGGTLLTKNKIIAFAEKLGIDISNTDKRGYPYLLLKKKGLVK